MNADQRRSNRFSLDLPCGIRTAGSTAAFHSAMIGDISRQGCSVITESPAEGIGQQVEISCALAGTDDSECIFGDVIRRERTAAGWRLGIEFQRIDPAMKWDMIDAAYHRWQAEHPLDATQE